MAVIDIHDNHKKRMSLEQLFAELEASQESHQNRLRSYALRLLETSTLRDSEEGEQLEDEICFAQISTHRWREIFEGLQLNQLRAIDMQNWSQTDFNKSYKHGIDN